jgi:hypothetical protein
MNLREVNVQYNCLVVFIRHDSAEIWGVRYGLILGIGTLKIMASTDVFVRVLCDLKRSISCDARTSSTILT